ncbi:MAG: methylated-DNA--[Oscillospiraceae bacterium]|nr:methylated-DNA--[protein]-cysteine S-methyltransferase [Oscillospiraceae bacterium]
MDCVTSYASPLGEITLASGGAGLCGLWFEGQRRFGGSLATDRSAGTSPALEAARRWLDLYFRGEAPDFLPPLELRGTVFQKAVWEALLEIPYGETVTYGALAARLSQRLGRAVSPRAVGAAVGRNSISLVIPCHRVLGANGSLTGYAGGLERKRRLLELEAEGNILK